MPGTSLPQRVGWWRVRLALYAWDEPAETLLALGNPTVIGLRWPMPTVLPVFKGWRVVVYPNDHLPSHVNVIGAGQHARFALLCDMG